MAETAKEDDAAVSSETERSNLDLSLREATRIRELNFGKRISFYAPSFMYYATKRFHSSPTSFCTISLTGNRCALNCKHCGGRVLETMYSATSPERLWNLCAQLAKKGSLGCLISGGCRPDGSVPLERFIGTIQRIKQELKLRIFVHTGIITHESATRLAEAGVDAALIDVIGSDETIKDIYKLNATVKDYEESLVSLQRVKLPFVPHVIVGFHYGKLKGEFYALEMISRFKPSALVVIAFMPIPGTEMENVSPPEPRDIAKVMSAARVMFPRTPLALGCMRPKGRHRKETDILAIRAGANAIAFPADEAIQFAEKLGLRVQFSSTCCSEISLCAGSP